MQACMGVSRRRSSFAGFFCPSLLSLPPRPTPEATNNKAASPSVAMGIKGQSHITLQCRRGTGGREDETTLTRWTLRLLLLCLPRPGLMKLINDYAPEAVKKREIENFFSRIIAIDASMSLYQFLVRPTRTRGAAEPGRAQQQSRPSSPLSLTTLPCMGVLSLVAA